MSLLRIEPFSTDPTASYTFGNANITSYLVTANANIDNLVVNTGANVTGNITIPQGNFFIGNGHYLTGITVSAGSGILNGNSNIAVMPNGNITFSVAQTANVATIASTGIYSNYFGDGGNLNNITGSNVTGNVTSAITANFANYAGNITLAAQGNITSLGLLTGLNVNGYTSFIGNANVLGNLNLSSGNANLGNIYGTILTASQPNITSVGNLTALNVTGNLVAGNLTVIGTTTYINSTTVDIKDPIIQLGTGANGAALTTNAAVDIGTVYNYYNTAAQTAFMGWKTANSDFEFVSNATVNSNNVITVNTLGNIRAGGANLGNSVTANYFVGNGYYLTGLSSGGSSVANGTSNVSIPLVNGNIQLTTNGNTTLVVTSTGINVFGRSNLGPVGNVVITGGTANSILVTDGSGDLSWGQASTLYSNTFTGTGTQTLFGPLPVTPSSINETFVNYNGVLQLRSSYTLSGANISFSSPPAFGALIEVTLVGVTAVVSSNGSSSATNIISNGNSNVEVNAGGSVVISANSVYGVAKFLDTGSNITSDLALANVNVSGIANLGSNANVKITGGTTGQSLITDGLGNLSWATITGGGGGGGGYYISNGNSSVTIVANSAIDITANGVANIVSFLDTGSYVNTNITMTKVSNLGSNANVKITGGTTGQSLITDGLGNLSWTSTGGASILYSDVFTGTGLQTSFGPLSATPTSINQTWINYNGVLQLRSSYSLSGANIVFTAPPAYGAIIEVTTLTAGSVNVSTSQIARSMVMGILFGG